VVMCKLIKNMRSPYGRPVAVEDNVGEGSARYCHWLPDVGQYAARPTKPSSTGKTVLGATTPALNIDGPCTIPALYKALDICLISTTFSPLPLKFLLPPCAIFICCSDICMLYPLVSPFILAFPLCCSACVFLFPSLCSSQMRILPTTRP
jgi:hypothetical protein